MEGDGRAALGRNQLIGIAGFGSVILIGAGLVLSGHLTGETWYLGGLGSFASLVGVGGWVNRAKAQASAPAQGEP